MARSPFTFYAVTDGTGIVTGINDDGSFTDAGSRTMDQAAGLDTAQGLMDGSIGTLTIHRLGSAVRKSLRHGAHGRADYVVITPRMHVKPGTDFRAFLRDNAAAKGLKRSDADRIYRAVRSHYGI